MLETQLQPVGFVKKELKYYNKNNIFRANISSFALQASPQNHSKRNTRSNENRFNNICSRVCLITSIAVYSSEASWAVTRVSVY